MRPIRAAAIAVACCGSRRAARRRVRATSARAPRLVGRARARVASVGCSAAAPGPARGHGLGGRCRRRAWCGRQRRAGRQQAARGGLRQLLRGCRGAGARGRTLPRLHPNPTLFRQLLRGCRRAWGLAGAPGHARESMCAARAGPLIKSPSVDMRTLCQSAVCTRRAHGEWKGTRLEPKFIISGSLSRVRMRRRWRARRTEELRVLREVEIGAGGQAPALDGLAVVRLRGLHLAREQAQVPAAAAPAPALPLSGQRQCGCTTAVGPACVPPHRIASAECWECSVLSEMRAVNT